MKRHFIRNERQSFATVKEAFSFVLACFASLGTRYARLFAFAKLPTQAWSPTLVKAQQTGFPKMFLKKTFWDVLIARLFRFLRTQSFHLSNNLTQSRTHSNFAYQVAEFKLGFVLHTRNLSSNLTKFSLHSSTTYQIYFFNQGLGLCLFFGLRPKAHTYQKSKKR